VVDATHPFAETISGNATSACALSGVPLVRLVRPGWSDLPEAARWHWVDNHDEAASVAGRLGRHVFLTTGRLPLASFVVPLASYDVLARVVDPPELALPATWEVLLDRGPYNIDAELSLMRERGIDVLVTKDSGGDLTRAKLDAADALGIEVIVVRRPASPTAVEQVSDLDGVLRWLRARQP
jgi:precorrin-6A/cobalt-precorrin-6A reductase